MVYYSTIMVFLFLVEIISCSGIYLGHSREEGTFPCLPQQPVGGTAGLGSPQWSFLSPALSSTPTGSHPARQRGQAALAERDSGFLAGVLAQSQGWFSAPHPGVPPPPSAVFPDNPSILSELCSTLSRLAVRNEFCQEVVDLGGLSVLVALLADCNDHQVGVHSCLRV